MDQFMHYLHYAIMVVMDVVAIIVLFRTVAWWLNEKSKKKAKSY